MKKDDLVLFGKYWIQYEEHGSMSYTGEAILIGFSPEGYGEGFYEFFIAGNEFSAVFDFDDIKTKLLSSNETVKNLDIILTLLEKGFVSKDVAKEAIIGLKLF